MATNSSERDISLSAKKKNHKWRVVFVTIFLTVYRLVKAARVIDGLIQTLRQWLTNL